MEEAHQDTGLSVAQGRHWERHCGSTPPAAETPRVYSRGLLYTGTATSQGPGCTGHIDCRVRPTGSLHRTDWCLPSPEWSRKSLAGYRIQQAQQLQGGTCRVTPRNRLVPAFFTPVAVGVAAAGAALGTLQGTLARLLHRNVKASSVSPRSPGSLTAPQQDCWKVLEVGVSAPDHSSVLDECCVES